MNSGTAKAGMRVSTAPVCAGCGAERVCAYRGDPARAGKPASRPQVRFTRDWRRVRCLDPDADTALLEGMESELRRRFRGRAGGKLMRLLEESLSLNVQMTEPKAYLAESLPAGMEELMRLYVEPPPRERVPRLSGRAAIQARMRAEFEQAGCGICCESGSRPRSTRGRAIRCGSTWATGRMGLIRMFHAVSLEPGVEMAKVLAFSAAGLAGRSGAGGEGGAGADGGDRAGGEAGSDRRGAGAAGDVPVWRGDDGGAPDPGADDLGHGAGGGDGAAGTAGVRGQRSESGVRDLAGMRNSWLRCSYSRKF